LASEDEDETADWDAAGALEVAGAVEAGWAAGAADGSWFGEALSFCVALCREGRPTAMFTPAPSQQLRWRQFVALQTPIQPGLRLSLLLVGARRRRFRLGGGPYRSRSSCVTAETLKPCPPRLYPKNAKPGRFAQTFGADAMYAGRRATDRVVGPPTEAGRLRLVPV
jgi:hypothetical protein